MEDPLKPLWIRLTHNEFPNHDFEIECSWDGRVQGFSVHTLPNSGATITARFLHEVPMGAFTRAIREFHVRAWNAAVRYATQNGLPPPTGGIMTPWKEIHINTGRKKSGGPIDIRDELSLAVLAAEYVELLEHASPASVLGDRYGYSTPRIKDFLKAARKRGLLSDPPFRGVAGGQLTKKAIRLLTEAQNDKHS